MLVRETGISQTPLPALTARVDATQRGRAKNETANCSAGQADHSNLSESSSAATPPLRSPGDSTVWANEQCRERCPPAKALSEKPVSSADKGAPLRTEQTLH